MNKPRVDPENLQFIHQRYEDAALVIFRQDKKKTKEPPLLTFGDTTKHFSYSSFGNAAVIVRRSGRDVTKMDERPIQSAFCTIMWYS